MTDFLVNKFIKDSTNIESTEVRTRYGMLASVVGIFCNVLLFSVKLTIGLILSSLAVTADVYYQLYRGDNGRETRRCRASFWAWKN